MHNNCEMERTKLTLHVCKLFSEQCCYNHPVKVPTIGFKERTSRDVLGKSLKVNVMVSILVVYSMKLKKGSRRFKKY